jgi:hypothetical protein
MKKLLFPVLCLTLVTWLTSCSKQIDQKASNTNTETAVPATVTSFASIKASDSFKWSTTNKVIFSFTGSSSDNYTSVLKVMDANGAIIFQKLQDATQNYAAVLEIAGTSENVTILFGDTNKTVSAKTGAINLTLN